MWIKILRGGCLPLLGLFAASAQAIPEGPAYPSPEWAQREATNFQKVMEAPREEAGSAAFMQRWQQQSAANTQSFIARDQADPSWLLVSSPAIIALVRSGADPANSPQYFAEAAASAQKNPSGIVVASLDSPVTPGCATWSQPCVGDPFLYPGTDPFYNTEAEVIPVVFYDDGCARLPGRVWAPKGSRSGSKLPAIVIQNGSVQAPETLYWWMARVLVRAGYVVLTFDPRGQGRADQRTPSGGQGSNANPAVFWTGLVNAIDFLRSTPVQPYPHNRTCAGSYPTQMTAFNPFSERIDPARLGIAGHSLGARGVSIVQGYGGVGADPWPGKLDTVNPVKVAVAWDGLYGPAGGTGGGAGGNIPGLSTVLGAASTTGAPKFAARVPSMGHGSEYGLTPTPYLQPPDPDSRKAAFAEWVKAGVPSYQITIQGSSHYEWSLLPIFPATSWCPSVSNNECTGGWGNPMAAYYTLAWFDRWLKNPGEPGYADADARLLNDTGEQGAKKMSFYFRSARFFTDRNGGLHDCADIRAGCTDTVVAAHNSSNADADTSAAGSADNASGGAMPLLALWFLGMFALLRRAQRTRR